MLSLFRHASRQAPTLTRGLATKSDHALSGVVQEAVDSAQHVAPTASRGGGTQVQYVPWPGEYKNRRPFNSVNTAMYYTPNDFQRSRRVKPLEAPRRTRPSGIGPSAERARARDQFINLGIDLEKEFRNGQLMSDFVTDMGMIKNRGQTGLSWASQRKLAKAIKRSRNMGIIPMYSKLQTSR